MRSVAMFGLVLVLAGCGGGDSGGDGGPVTPSARGSISGSVVDDGNTGIAGTSVQLSREGQSSRSATSGSDGRFSFTDLSTGTWTADLSPPSGFVREPSQTYPVNVNVIADQSASLTLRLRRQPAGTISGTVRAAGAAVPSAAIALSGAATRQTATSAAGIYSFATLAAGAYSVTITPPAGFALASGENATKNATLAANGTATIDFQLQSTGGTVQTITLSATRFNPSAVTIARGTTVRWTNNTGILHTVTPDGHSEWESKTLSGNTTVFEHRFDNAGTFPYYCEPHRDSGMTGTIVVQ